MRADGGRMVDRIHSIRVVIDQKEGKTQISYDWKI